MTDRYAALVVTLSGDIREDDAQSLIAAIRMMRLVAGVEPVRTETTQRMVESMRVRQMVAAELHHFADLVLRDKVDGD
jgi:hypothetical protein